MAEAWRLRGHLRHLHYHNEEKACDWAAHSASGTEVHRKDWYYCTGVAGPNGIHANIGSI